MMMGKIPKKAAKKWRIDRKHRGEESRHSWVVEQMRIELEIEA
jgi:hypothetical protein